MDELPEEVRDTTTSPPPSTLPPSLLTHHTISSSPHTQVDEANKTDEAFL